MTPEKARALEDLADKLDDPRRTRDFLEDRVTFYHLLYAHDQNPVLVGMIDQLRSSVGRDLLGLRVHDHAHHHREIVDLVVARDADRCPAVGEVAPARTCAPAFSSSSTSTPHDRATGLGVLTGEVGQAGDRGAVPAGGVGSVVVVLVQPCCQGRPPLGL